MAYRFKDLEDMINNNVTRLWQAIFALVAMVVLLSGTIAWILYQIS